jgi:hypothetical protein
VLGTSYCVLLLQVLCRMKKLLGVRYFLLCLVIASVVQDEEVVEWSEASALVWPVQLKLWFKLR